MSYQRIAELVHELVKTPKSMLQDKKLSLGQLKMNEFTSIQRVFSDLEVSRDVLTFESIPLDYW